MWYKNNPMSEIEWHTHTHNLMDKPQLWLFISKYSWTLRLTQLISKSFKIRHNTPFIINNIKYIDCIYYLVLHAYFELKLKTRRELED